MSSKTCSRFNDPNVSVNYTGLKPDNSYSVIVDILFVLIK